eukprot:9497583-Pyramimonas_sp.AAC.1
MLMSPGESQPIGDIRAGVQQNKHTNINIVKRKENAVEKVEGIRCARKVAPSVDSHWAPELTAISPVSDLVRVKAIEHRSETAMAARLAKAKE